MNFLLVRPCGVLCSLDRHLVCLGEEHLYLYGRIRGVPEVRLQDMVLFFRPRTLLTYCAWML